MLSEKVYEKIILIKCIMVAFLFCEIKNEDFFCETCNNFVTSDVEIYKKAIIFFLLSLYRCLLYLILCCHEDFCILWYYFTINRKM